MEENRIRTRVILAYFSPSGTTLKTLNNIALGMGDVEIERLDMSVLANRQKTHSFEKTDIVIYGTITGALLFAPNKEIFTSFQGNGAYFVGIAQYGNGYYGVTLKQLQKRALKQGFRVIALGAFIGQHSEDKSVATGRPDERDAEIQAQFGKDIMEKYNMGKFSLSQQPKTGWSISPLYNMVVLLRHFQMDSDYELPAALKRKRINEAKCIQCRSCEKNCPVQAIRVDSKEFDLKKCIACYRCVNRCPKQAIEVTSKIMNMVVADFGKRVGKPKRHEPTVVL